VSNPLDGQPDLIALILKSPYRRIFLEIQTLAQNLFKDSEEETRKWLLSSTEALFGSSPVEIILQGEGQTLIDWLRERSS
jgi:hypothetical protein